MIWFNPPPDISEWATVDDAVKIGLGAMIGALTALSVAWMGIRSSRTLELTKARRAAIEKIGVDFMLASYDCQLALKWRLQRMEAESKGDQDAAASASKSFEEHTADPFDLHNRLLMVQARCRFFKLQAEPKVKEYISLFSKTIVDPPPALEVVKVNREKLTGQINEIIDLMGKAYQ